MATGPFETLAMTSLGAGDFDGDDALDLLVGSFGSLYPFTSACSTQVSLYSVSPMITASVISTMTVSLE